MLDTSKCQKPERRMNFRGIRSSKFRHVYGAPAKKDKCFENVRITRNAHDGNYCAANPKFLAVVVEVGGGGSFLVVPLDKCGRVDHNSWKVAGHAGPVLDIKWNPFNDNIIASASEDCTVKVWYIPDGGLSQDLTECLIQLQGHRRRVGLLEWHPTAENILASVGYDHLVIIWNMTRGQPVHIIDCHQDTIYSMSFNRNGSLLATTCKDKKIRIIDPRTGEVLRQGKNHQGTKASKVVYLGDTGRLFTTGFSKFSDRQFAIWSDSDLSEPLRMETIDSSSGVLYPWFDPDTNMVYVAGKGDGNVRYYEQIPEAPWACYLSQFISGAPQRGFGVLPKRGVNVSSCEVFRFFKLHATKDLVEPVSMIVPRKSDSFQDDIYPETLAPIPALSAEEWLSGKTMDPVLISMRTGSQLRTFKPMVYKPQDNTVIVSEKNNDRKHMFLSVETKPDYRPVEGRKEIKPSPKMDHRPQGAALYQRSQSEYHPKKHLDLTDGGHTATEKELKTSLNMGTKFQEVQKKWSGGSLGSPALELDIENMYKTSIQSGSASVRSLSSKFDYRDNRDNRETEENTDTLKRTVNDQAKQISNLRAQVESKDKKIQELEERVLSLTRNNTPLTSPTAFSQPEHSFA